MYPKLRLILGVWAFPALTNAVTLDMWPAGVRNLHLVFLDLPFKFPSLRLLVPFSIYTVHSTGSIHYNHVFRLTFVSLVCISSLPGLMRPLVQEVNSKKGIRSGVRQRCAADRERVRHR
jgi:hypothetical protein